MKKENFLILLFLILLVAVLAMWYITAPPQVGLSPSSSAQSSVTVGANIDIALSANLANGVDFSSVPAGTSDVASTDNANGAGTSSTLSVARQVTTNTDIKICISANGPLTNAGLTSTIPLAGETYSHSPTTSASLPAGPAGSVALTTSGVVASGTMTAASPTTFYRVWLDVPAGTTADTYTNQINFVAVQASGVCP